MGHSNRYAIFMPLFQKTAPIDYISFTAFRNTMQPAHFVSITEYADKVNRYVCACERTYNYVRVLCVYEFIYL